MAIQYMTVIYDRRLSVTSISFRLLHVNENDEIGIKSGTMGFRGKVRNRREGQRGAGGVCAWCKRGVHTCVAHRFAFPERLREREEEKSEGRECGEGGST